MTLDIGKIKSFGTLVSYPKNFFLLKEGSYGRKLWVLEKGIARYIYYQGDREYTGWIDLEGDIVGSVFGALGMGAAQESIQLVEDSDLYEIVLDDIRRDETFYEVFKTQILQFT